jgi:hypothetical protein
MFETFRSIAAGIFLLAPLPFATEAQVERFSSIELPKGGHVILRPSGTQRVTLVRGSLDYTRLSVNDRGALVVDRCYRKCPRGYRLELEILSPNVSRISLANGGSVETRGAFARQRDLTIAVAHGGTIDVRSIAAQRVIATVEQGGRILTVPQTSLVASVSHGGVVTFWGDGQVTSSIERGGVVHKGTAAELDLPLSQIGLPLLSHRTKGGR